MHESSQGSSYVMCAFLTILPFFYRGVQLTSFQFVDTCFIASTINKLRWKVIHHTIWFCTVQFFCLQCLHCQCLERENLPYRKSVQNGHIGQQKLSRLRQESSAKFFSAYLPEGKRSSTGQCQSSLPHSTQMPLRTVTDLLR